MSLIPKVDVLEGTSGPWSIARFDVSKRDAEFANLRDMINSRGRGTRPIVPGTYTKLSYHGGIVMSDVPAEMRDHIDAVIKAKDHCLVNGLGLGMVVNAMLLKKEVLTVTVVELDPCVIDLVGGHYREKFGDRIKIIEDDARLYKPPKGMHYAAVWHDIWPTICADNLKEMASLHRKYAKRSDWQGSWCRAECRYAARQGGY